MTTHEQLDKMHLCRMLAEYRLEWILQTIIDELQQQKRDAEFQRGPGMIGALNR